MACKSELKWHVKGGGIAPTPGFKLKITKEKEEIWIRGNQAGLEYLSGVCRAMIGKTDPAGHFHIWSEMGNASPGSERTLLEFSDNEEDYK